jgi:hypothetical protein
MPTFLLYEQQQQAAPNSSRQQQKIREKKILTKWSHFLNTN